MVLITYVPAILYSLPGNRRPSHRSSYLNIVPRLVIATLAPALAKPWAMAFPTALPPPVTIATLPLSENLERSNMFATPVKIRCPD